MKQKKINFSTYREKIQKKERYFNLKIDDSRKKNIGKSLYQFQISQNINRKKEFLL